jgi:hypothetical protein
MSSCTYRASLNGTCDPLDLVAAALGTLAAYVVT